MAMVHRGTNVWAWSLHACNEHMLLIEHLPIPFVTCKR
jgi:hypothetical protein